MGAYAASRDHILQGIKGLVELCLAQRTLIAPHRRSVTDIRDHLDCTPRSRSGSHAWTASPRTARGTRDRGGCLADRDRRNNHPPDNSNALDATARALGGFQTAYLISTYLISTYLISTYLIS